MALFSTQQDMKTSDKYISAGALAEQFGWTPRFLDGLVRGEKIPGKQFDQEWRFSRSELISWLEQKIRTLDHTRVVELENRISPALREPDEHDPVTLQLSKSGIRFDVDVADKDELLKKLVDFAFETGATDKPDALLEALFEREALCSTAMSGGVAICHPRQRDAGLVRKPFVRLIRTSSEIPFGAEDQQATRLFFLLVEADDRGHLKSLARLARIIDESTRLALHHAKSPLEAYKIIEAREVAIDRKKRSIS